jgi:hypothetical protein
MSEIWFVGEIVEGKKLTLTTRNVEENLYWV